jgi:outer membrane receptor protein involved in Fe transport
LGTDRSFCPTSRVSWRFPIAWKAIAFISALLAVAEPAPGLARDIEYRIDLPAGPIGTSLSTLSQATGISVGLSGEFPQFQARSVRGSLTPAEALRRLLTGTDFTAVQIGPSTFRIERVPAVNRPSPQPVQPPVVRPPDTAVPLPEIVVTAQKRQQNLSQIPMSLAVVSPDSATAGGVAAGSRELGLSVEGIALTNLGPGRNRQFIRGVADSPFGGISQSTVAVQLDEARVTYDAPDPDLRLVDIERVEILKGPQGPLYGSGALGGIYHLVTRKPQLDKFAGTTRLLTEVVQHGGIGYGGELVLNLPLATDHLALRAVGYGLRGAGWIDNIGRRHDTNVSHTYGGRLALRWQPSADWTIDVGGTLQYLNVADSQYVTRSETTLQGGPHLPEPIDNDFREVGATIEGHVAGLRLLSATSYVSHDVAYTLDASDAAAKFGMSGPVKFRDESIYSIVNQELRVGPESGGRWIAGLSYMRAHSHSDAVISDTIGTHLPVQTLDRVVTEYAAFGEATLGLARQLDATAGIRVYRAIAEDEAIESSNGRTDRITKTAVSPSLSLAWKPPGKIIYLRYARALRPGGLAADGQSGPQRFASDELGTFDLGIRQDSPDRHFSFAASLFYTRWSHIQSDFLLPNGLVSTRNAGRGQIIGGEASAEWRVMRGLRLAGGVNLEHARLTHSEQEVALTGRRLPITPDITARMTIDYDFAIGRWAATLAAQGNYIGRTRLALDENLDREMGDYAIFSGGASFTRDRLTIAARIDNLLDVKGDSFAFGNPFSIMTGRQFTPLRPRTLTISIARSW